MNGYFSRMYDHFCVLFHIILQKQPFRGIVRKRCSENMLQIYRRTPIPKCDTSAWVFSCKSVAYFQNTFFYEYLWMAASGTGVLSTLPISFLARGKESLSSRAFLRIKNVIWESSPFLVFFGVLFLNFLFLLVLFKVLCLKLHSTENCLSSEDVTKLSFICSKSTLETLKKDVKYVQS